MTVNSMGDFRFSDYLYAMAAAIVLNYTHAGAKIRSHAVQVQQIMIDASVNLNFVNCLKI